MKNAFEHLEGFFKDVQNFAQNEVNAQEQQRVAQKIEAIRAQQNPQYLQSMKSTAGLERWNDTNAAYMQQSDALELAGYQTVTSWMDDRMTEFERQV